MPSFVSIAEVRALVRSRLSDTDLQVIIDREEDWLATKVGTLTGARTETFDPDYPDAPVQIVRRSASVVVTDDGTTLAATDFMFTPSTGMVRRVTVVDTRPGAVGPYFASWQGTVTVTHTPVDGAVVKKAVIDLVRGTVGETGFESEQLGDYSYTRGARSAMFGRLAIVRSVLLRRPAYSARLRTVLEPA